MLPQDSRDLVTFGRLQYDLTRMDTTLALGASVGQLK